MTEREFASCIALLCATVGRDMPPEQSKAWYAMLGDLTIETLKAGIIATVRSYTFAGFPPIGMIRENCGVASGVIPAKDRPLLAWQAVRGSFANVGAYDSPAFDDAIIHATIRELGGWPLLCDTPTEEMHWLEKRFCATYSALSSVKLPSDQTKRLAGITETENGREGYASALIPVAHIRCLTSPNVAAEPFARRLAQQPVPKLTGPHNASQKLAKRLTVEAPEPEQSASPPKSKEECLEDLKNWTNSRNATAN